MLEDQIFYYKNENCHVTSLVAKIRRNEVVFIVKDLKKRTELLTVDVVKEKNMAASLSISSNTGYTDFNFSVRNDAKDSDNGSKTPENSRLAYHEVPEDALPLAKIKILMKINLVLLGDTVNGYLTRT